APPLCRRLQRSCYRLRLQPVMPAKAGIQYTPVSRHFLPPTKSPPRVLDRPCEVSHPHLSGADAIVQGCVEPHKSLGRRIVEIDRIADAFRIETLRHQLDLLLIEGGGDVDAAAGAQEQRQRIV